MDPAFAALFENPHEVRKNGKENSPMYQDHDQGKGGRPQT